MSTLIVSPESVKEDIRAVLSNIADGDFQQTAVALLHSLGYASERTLGGETGNPADLIRLLSEQTPGTPGLTGTQSERAFLDNAQSARILFQFTSSEIGAQAQQELFNNSTFDTGNARSFIFAAVELKDDSYPRSRYAAFTRELNKRIQLPMVVLFRTGANRITLAFVHRRPNRRDPSRDVLGSVSLIREIDPASPHRAHLDILAELSLPERLGWMEAHGKPRNFDGLLDAWLDALDTEELNRRFYRDLFSWFEQAVKDAKFPAGEARSLPTEEHVIRLITRLMFAWFIKEKGLVAQDLFIENRAAQLLKDYARDTGDSYYRAVLQNLFFATLNTEIEQRGFSSENNDTHRDFSLYRYRREIADPDALLALFAQTPFINGGLFDCLDSFDATGAGGYRVDCFSDNRAHSRLLSIPNRLFFSGDGHSPGLIDLFNRYKFTVEENTPAEREVALDPELLGKVFENLLAAFNPETRENVRKQTGSYYTPRAVVEYMVDEALVATLAQRALPADGDVDYWQERLRYLLDYDDAFSDAEELFSPVEREAVVRAIAETKALDPAVGSGAFPMGILHKLTLALRRLDSGNELWERVQREEAASRSADAYRDVGDDQQRQEALAEVENTFLRYRDSDYGRKLYLIQNCIYGVDIQPVATQIAKLRFFISLAIEQQPNDDRADNYGIRPLPNLEARFVAADTLLALEKPTQLTLGQTDEVQRLESELAANRERYFHADSRRGKLECRNRDKELRQQLAAALQSERFPAVSAGKLADWDAFDQNAKPADWFDPQFMFGVGDGFDVVIANPPYLRQEDISPKAYKDVLAQQYAAAAVARSDLYCYFYARALQLLRDGGMHVFVCSNSWLDVGYGAKLQEYLLNNAHIQAIYESAVERQFSTADINTIITLIRKGRPSDNAKTHFVSLRDEFYAALADPQLRREIVRGRAALRAGATVGNKFVGDKWGGKYLRAPDIYHRVLDKYGDKLERLGDVATVRRGVSTGANDFFFPTPTRIAEFGIEPEYCRPVMTTPQESRSITVDPARLPKRLFMCHEDKEGLEGTGALAYIEWGEAQGYHRRTSVKSRRRWYDLGERDTTRLAVNYLIDTTARTFFVQDGLLFGDNFQELRSGKVSPLQLCAMLNSTLSQMMFNISGRANFGGGLMKIQTFEIEGLQIVNPSLLPEPEASIFNAIDWDVLTPSAARRHIDVAVFDTLGLTAGERDAVYAGVAELVENRKRRARSVGGSASAAGPTKIPRKPDFQVVPNLSGLAPDVTPDNLKDIIQDLEDEELLEKLGQ